MAALFADVNLISALFVSVADVHAVDFATVRFKRTPLCKGSVALATCVRFHTCKKRNGEIRLLKSQKTYDNDVLAKQEMLDYIYIFLKSFHIHLEI